jgi:hypothetical protein
MDNEKRKKLREAVAGQSGRETLQLNEQLLGDEGAFLLAELLPSLHPDLRVLEIVGNNITALGFQKLCGALIDCKRLKVLRAEWNVVGSRTLGVEALFQLLRLHTSLERVDLRNNKIGDHCAGIIASIVEINHGNLKELDLKWNELTNNGAEKILKALFRNRHLRVLDLYSNRASNALLLKIEDLLSRNRANEVREEGPEGRELGPRGDEPMRMGEIERTIHLRQILASETAHFNEVIKQLETQISAKKMSTNQKLLAQKDYVLRLESLSEESAMLKEQIEKVNVLNDKLSEEKHRGCDFKLEEEREIRKAREHCELQHRSNVQAYEEKAKYELSLLEEDRKERMAAAYDKLRYCRELKEELNEKVLQLAEERLRMKLEFEALNNRATQTISEKIRKKNQAVFNHGEEKLAEEEIAVSGLRRKNELMIGEIGALIKKTQESTVSYDEQINNLRQDITSKHNQMSRDNLEYEKAGIKLRFTNSRLEEANRDLECLQHELRSLSSANTQAFDDMHDHFRKEKALSSESMNEYHKRIIELERMIRLQEQTNGKVRAQLEKVCTLVENSTIRTVHHTLGKLA